MGRVTSQQVYFLSRGTKNDHSFLKEVFSTKGGIFLYNSTNFDKKKSKVPYFTHNEIHSNVYCIHYIAYNYVYCIQNRRFWLLRIYTMGGNLCKYAYHLLYINATFIRLVYKYNKNITFFVQFLYVFVPKLAKNCTKLTIFVLKLYKN